ncbi:DUF3413 domain-containing protein [Pseudoalteromonas sp. SCSIO 43201]|uniref:DUF3413 domain-containing protein n=1 Tax=Pseudoalteromonas sp. SCSIO 43201 TaxID=2822842 RepID=UPI0033658605
MTLICQKNNIPLVFSISGTSRVVSLRHRLHQFGWLVLINSLFSILLAANVVNSNPNSYQGLTLFYATVSTWGHMALLTGAISLVLLPLVWVKSEGCRALGFSAFYAFFFALLIANSLCFELYKFHINGVIIDMLLAGQVIELSVHAWIQASVIFVLLFVCQYILVKWSSRPKRLMSMRLGRKYVVATCAAVLASNTIHVWASANVYQPITGFSKYLPLFKPATANTLLRQYELIDEAALAQQKSMSLVKGQFNYPLHRLEADSVTAPNIVVIVLDSWRYDAFTKSATPNIWAFAKHGLTFEQHFSTGNSTRTGITGLFYSLTGTYWQDIYNNRAAPLWMDRMRELNYQFGIFSSAQLIRPEFNETVFSNINGLQTHTEGDDVLARDRQITKNWLSWYDNKAPAQPSFSFLFYDAIHGYAVPDGYQAGFQPMHGPINHMLLHNNYERQPVYNRYLTSTHFVDSLVASVLAKINRENTLVIITSDHGEELNDNKLNYWGHNSNFSTPQVKVPFIVVGPKVEKWRHWKTSRATTSHLDVAPTIMKTYLGVKNEVQDFALGMSLTEPAQEREWLLLSSYNKYAIVNRQQIIEVSTLGTYEVLDHSNRPTEQVPNYKHVQHALEQSRHFQ